LVDELLHAVADHSRRRMLEALSTTDATAGELAELLPIARPGVSRHLRVLREAGLVAVRHEGQRRVYSLRAEQLFRLDEWLAPFRKAWQQRFDALHTEVARGSPGRARSKREDTP
jgi:DNA-binding transcriptional ArsR family regulator